MPGLIPGLGRSIGEGIGYPLQYSWASLVVKKSSCSAGDLGSIPGLGRFPGGGHDNPLQYSCLEKPHGEISLVGYSLWGRQESDMTERLSTAQCNVRQYGRGHASGVCIHHPLGFSITQILFFKN